jgi:hypothetical protein
MQAVQTHRGGAADWLAALPLEKFLARYDNERRRRRVEPVYRAMLAEASRLAAPAAMHAQVPAEQVPELAGWLPPGPVAVVLAVCTAGAKFDERTRELLAGALAEAAVLDEISTALVRLVTNTTHQSIRAEAQTAGLKTGAPYRPGLGRCPMEAQRTIFGRLPAQDIGVTLHEGGLMHPAKTTSLVIPLFRSTP